MRTRIPCPTARNAVPIAAVVFPLPGPVFTMMSPRRTSFIVREFLIVTAGHVWRDTGGPRSPRVQNRVGLQAKWLQCAPDLETRCRQSGRIAQCHTVGRISTEVCVLPASRRTL